MNTLIIGWLLAGFFGAWLFIRVSKRVFQDKINRVDYSISSLLFLLGPIGFIAVFLAIAVTGNFGKIR